MTGEDRLRLLRARAAEVVVGVELEAAREAVRDVLGGRVNEEEGLRGRLVPGGRNRRAVNS